MDAHERGDATEAAVIAELKRRGIAVSRPFGDNERYDAVVATPTDRLLRIQIKTGWVADGVIEFHGKSQHTNADGNTYDTYEGDVDYFLVYVPELETMYLVGEWEFETGMQLRIEAPARTDPSIHWAADYEFDVRWPPRRSDRTLGRGNAELETAIGRLQQRGFAVAWTVTTDDYDLLVETEDGPVRLAVESAPLRDGCVRLRPGGRVDRQLVDWFLVYCAGTETLYLVPPEEFTQSISLRVADAEKDLPSINWAREYAFDRQWGY